LRYAQRKGLLRRARGVNQPSCSPSSPTERSARDGAGEAGIAVKRTAERALARVGALREAPARLEPAEAVPAAGVLLALPELERQGLLEVFVAHYRSLKGGFFGLRSVVLMLAFMALLRIKSLEQLKGHAPGELGLLLGLDRAPEVKTLRRKLAELAARGKAHECAEAFARRWARQQPEALAYLYVDGHVRPYHGRKHKLPKTHVQRRRLCMPATTDFWVNDARAEPLLVVTAEANNSLLSMLEEHILARVRTHVGPERRVTVLFDREGWSPRSFKRWKELGFDVMTYRKGRYEPWPEEQFVGIKVDERRPRPTVYRLAERTTALSKSFSMREVRRLCDDGHQTSVMTTREDLPIQEVACRMFARWRQENFFRYMRHDYALDHLCTYQVEPAEAHRSVPNPERKACQKALQGERGELERLKKAYAEAALANPESRRPTMRGFKIANAELGKRIRAQQARCEELACALKALPKRVALEELMAPEHIVKLERERKTLTDTIKMVAYRAESSLLRLIEPLFPRHEDEGRAFLKAVFQTPADLLPDESTQLLLVRFHSMAHPRFNRVLGALCEILTAQHHRYPGTRLRMVFEGP